MASLNWIAREGFSTAKLSKTVQKLQELIIIFTVNFNLSPAKNIVQWCLEATESFPRILLNFPACRKIGRIHAESVTYSSSATLKTSESTFSALKLVQLNLSDTITIFPLTLRSAASTVNHYLLTHSSSLSLKTTESTFSAVKFVQF